MENNNQQPKKTKFFNVLPLEKVIKQADDTPKRMRATHNKDKIQKRVEKLKQNRINYFEGMEIDKTPQIGESISGFLNECHPDLRKFIDNNEWLKIVASPGRMIVETRNKFRIVIDVISRFSKSVSIKDGKGNEVFNGLQTVHFK